MPTVAFRGGCLTGPGHAGTELHGFLSYLMICAVGGRSYRVLGYKGKQVRDNIHSFDLVEAFVQFMRAPAPAKFITLAAADSIIARSSKPLVYVKRLADAN